MKYHQSLYTRRAEKIRKGRKLDRADAVGVVENKQIP